MLWSLLAVQTNEQASDQLDFLRNKLDCALLIDGESLQVCANFSIAFHTLLIQFAALLAVSGPLPKRVHRNHNPAISRSGMPLLSNTESRCCEADSSTYRKESVLHWRWWE